MRPVTSVLCAFVLLAAACGVEPAAGPTKDSSTLPPTAPATPAATATAPDPNSLAMPVGLPSVVVSRVVDGDTMDVQYEGETLRLRLIGVDTPETVDPRQPVQCFGREASDFAKATLDSHTVFVESDPTQGDRDAFGRALRYVWLPDGRMFNLALIAEGYAFEYTFRTPYKYVDAFKEAQRQALKEGRGLWAPDACVTPSPTTGTVAPTAIGDCEPSYPDVCIPRHPPDLDCGEIAHRRFRVIGTDPHRFDVDRNGVGCES